MTPPPRREPSPARRTTSRAKTTGAPAASRAKSAAAQPASRGAATGTPPAGQATPPWREEPAAQQAEERRPERPEATAAPSVVALRRLLQHRKLLVASLLLAIIAGVLSGNRLTLSPLKLEARGTSYGFANSKLLIDSDRTRVGDVSKQLGALGDRAEVFTSLMTSDPVRSAIAQRLGVPTTDISTRVLESGATIGDNSDAEGQLDAIRQSSSEYQLTFEAERSGPNGSVSLPLIDVTGQASTALKARQLVDAAGTVASTYFTSRASRRGVQQQNAARATPVGRAEGVLVLGGASEAISLLVGLVTFVVLCGLILTYVRFAQDWEAAGAQSGVPKRQKRRRSRKAAAELADGEDGLADQGADESARTRTASSA